MAESFFGLLKRERVHRRRYRTRTEARADLFDDIERFYNRQRSHSFTQGLAPKNFVEQHDQQSFKLSVKRGEDQYGETKNISYRGTLKGIGLIP
ncbi:MAG: IS3 family transposase [Nitrospira sp.]|nr:IS3 family transposase [Nitrospira sp.]